MTTSISHFVTTVDEIEQNSWWASKIGPKLKDVKLSYSIRDSVESITEVPQESLESLLLRIRRMTMNKSAEHLLSVQKALTQSATLDSDRHLLDVWRKYWRLAFIKEPFHLEQAGERQVMTGYKVYQCFINGHFFHTNDPAYNLILYNSSTPRRMAGTHLFFKNIFHSVVLDLGLAAIGLHRYVQNGNTFQGLALNDGIATTFAFVWERNRVENLDEQYRIFNDWIEENGGCNDGRWT
jgi:hypothetical protein